MSQLNLVGLIKAARVDETYSFWASVAPALLGTAGGAAAGYLTGSDEDPSKGIKSTRTRNALIGALLGNVGTGALFYNLNKDMLSHVGGVLKGEGSTKQANAANVVSGAAGAGLGLAGTIGNAFSLPAILGLLGGGAAGWALTSDEKNKFRNSLLGALTGFTGGTLGSMAYRMSDKDRVSQIFNSIDPDEKNRLRNVLKDVNSAVDVDNRMNSAYRDFKNDLSTITN